MGALIILARRIFIEIPMWLGKVVGGSVGLAIVGEGVAVIEGAAILTTGVAATGVAIIASGVVLGAAVGFGVYKVVNCFLSGGPKNK